MTGAIHLLPPYVSLHGVDRDITFALSEDRLAGVPRGEMYYPSQKRTNVVSPTLERTETTDSLKVIPWSRCFRNSVITVTMLRAERPRSVASIPGKCNKLFFYCKCSEG